MKLLEKQGAKLLEWINGTEAEVTGEEEPLHTNMRPVVIFGFAVLIFGFFGFIIWASLAPMISGVNMPGTVTAASEEVVLQSRYGGTIEKIPVKEGETVKKNQPLVIFDDAQQKSNLAAVKSRYITYLAMYARLKAEDSGSDSLKFPRALLSFGRRSVHAKEAIATQKRLFITETQNFKSEEDILKANVSSIKSYIKSAEELKKSIINQIALAKKELLPLERLSRRGYYPKVKVIDLKSGLESLEGKLNEETGNISRMEGSLSENELKLGNLRNNFLTKVNNQLNGVQNSVFALKQEYGSALSQYKHSRITSPTGGVVVKIFNKTIGGAVMPGQPIADVLPLHQSLIVRGDIPIQDIARIHKGLTANLRFPAFDVADVPVLDGRVIYVSANSMTNPASHMSFYICKIKINKDGLKTLARRKLKLKAGMPVEVTVKTGAKTLMSALLNPLLYKISNAFVK